jgi:hypothetical protein
MELLGGSHSCSQADCPMTFCSCFCHTHAGVMHCMPCCGFETCSKCGEGKSRVTFDYGMFEKVKANE